MTVLLRDAIKPNLLQTLEGGPAFVHCGPFANIAHGNSSILADRLALATTDIVCTEAGFGADMGAEKFFDIKCRASGLRPDAAVMVATVRALKMHGGVGRIVAGQAARSGPRGRERRRRSGAARRTSLKHIEIVGQYNVPVVVAINWFPTDTPAEIEAIREVALAAGARDAVVSRHFAEGGAGAADLAAAVWRAAAAGRAGLPLPLPGRRDAAREDRGDRRPGLRRRRASTSCRPPARAIDQFERLGFGRLPICMAKTQYSISHDPSLLGRPSGFRIPIRDVRLSAGAGFVTPLLGEMRTMPGLPSRPGGELIDIDADGNIVGLF